MWMQTNTSMRDVCQQRQESWTAMQDMADKLLGCQFCEEEDVKM